MSSKSRLTERQTFWLGHLRACGSGSLKAYAQANGLDVRALYEAKARLKRKGALGGAGHRLVRVEPAQAQASAGGYCRVHLRNGTAVDVACSAEQWTTLFASVAALP
jgi:hypothetical protein